MSFPQTIDPAQANKETPIGEDLRALIGAATFGIDLSTTTGLTVHWHGSGSGQWGGFTIADGSQLLGASTTTYMVVLRSSGAVSFSTGTTNWNDSTSYARCYAFTTSASGITTYADHRFGPGGAHGSAATAGAGTELKGLTFTSDTDSTADSDPGNGLFKWNNATQGSATFLYFDNQTADAVSLTTLWASLASAGMIYLQQADDASKWQLWKWAATPTDGTGYRKFAVTLQASGGSIADAKTVYVDFDNDSSGSGGTTGKHAIYIAAAAMSPSATGGCAALATIATSANRPDIQSLDFDATTAEYAQFSFAMPKSWNEGTVTFRAHWSHASTTTNFGVAWELQALAVSDDDTVDAAYGTAVAVTDTGGTTSDLYITAESSAITIAGTPAAEDMVFFRIARNPANGSDTMAIDARLHGVTVYITTDAETDA